MALSQKLEMRQGMSLVMTPQLLQAIKLLQLSHQELSAYIDEELERNPLLERQDAIFEEAAPAPSPSSLEEPWLKDHLDLDQKTIESDLDTSLENVFPDESVSLQAREADLQGVQEHGPSLSFGQGSGSSAQSWQGEDFDAFATVAEEQSLHDYLGMQLDCATTDPRQRLIGCYLIDAIDEAGYLSEPLADLAARLGASLAEAENVLHLIQRFEPSGVGARTLAECLALQLRERNRFDPAIAAMLDRLDLVARRDFVNLRKICGVGDDDLQDMMSEIRQLEPKPGRAFGAAPLQLKIPDVLVRPSAEGGWHIELNPDTLPKILVDQTYAAHVSAQAREGDEKTFIAQCLSTATWLTRSLEQRSRTILAVAAEIVRQQDAFFAHGIAHLRPLTLKMVADVIGMHESTVSRVTSNKAIATDRGVFEMKYFFSASINSGGGLEHHASESVRYRIRQLIESESVPGHLSDDSLVTILKKEGIEVARRTIAKYREAMRIPSSTERRRSRAPI
jgi:RNA polymerase sigma-54 factor